MKRGKELLQYKATKWLLKPRRFNLKKQRVTIIQQKHYYAQWTQLIDLWDFVCVCVCFVLDSVSRWPDCLELIFWSLPAQYKHYKGYA